MAQFFARAFYNSQVWRDFRFNLIIERGPICQRCNTVVVDTSTLVGHHRIKLTPLNIADQSITLNPANVELICFDCHNQDHRRFGHQGRHDVYIIYGSPMSGKSTLANQMAEYGDMILDIDRIYEAISGLPRYEKPENLRFNVFRIRDIVLDMIKTRYGQWHDAYIVGGYPIKAERERLARELGAELIYVGSTREECKQRVVTSGKSGRWNDYIDRWWRDYVA